jgi:hypothetical protein
MSLAALAELTRSIHTRSLDDAPCPDWQVILDRYNLAVRAYSHAVADLARRAPDGLAEAWLRAERARKNCDGARTELLDHEHHHDCRLPSS